MTFGKGQKSLGETSNSFGNRKKHLSEPRIRSGEGRVSPAPFSPEQRAELAGQIGAQALFVAGSLEEEKHVVVPLVRSVRQPGGKLRRLPALQERNFLVPMPGLLLDPLELGTAGPGGRSAVRVDRHPGVTVVRRQQDVQEQGEHFEHGGDLFEDRAPDGAIAPGAGSREKVASEKAWPPGRLIETPCRNSGPSCYIHAFPDSPIQDDVTTLSFLVTTHLFAVRGKLSAGLRQEIAVTTKESVVTWKL